MEDISDRAVLVTGANRGIGQALVDEALRRGAKRVYAGTRQPLAHSDGRVTPLTLDVTDAAQIRAAVEKVESLDILVNNAGLGLYADLSDRGALEQHLAVNLFGSYDVTQAFMPLLTRSRGAIVNVLSLAALAGLPLDPTYSISKAAAFSLTQSLRAALAGRGVDVFAVLPGPVDTDMGPTFDIPKASPESVARAIFDGVENGDEEIFPDPMSESMAEGWRDGASKALERQMAAFVAAEPVEEDMTTSRSLISAMQVTLDGYSSEGDAEWVDSWADGLELLPPVDAFLLGGGMFPDYERFWATILDDPSAASEMLGRDPYPREIAYAHLAAETPHLVLSKTLSDPTWPTARIVHDINEIRTFKQQPGKAVYVVGGPGLVASLIDAGLLDELRLIVHPVVTGGGTAVFGGIAERQALELVSAEPTTAGRVNLTYRLGASTAQTAE